jgi:hypothetical protein
VTVSVQDVDQAITLMRKAMKRKRMSIEFPPKQFAEIQKTADSNFVSFGAQVRVLASIGIRILEQVEKVK